MPAKKGAQSKDQQTQQQSQQQPIPSSSAVMTGSTVATTAAGKAESVQQQQQQLVQMLQENADPVTVVMSVVDKKVRNLDKRKVLNHVMYVVSAYVHCNILACLLCVFIHACIHTHTCVLVCMHHLWCCLL